MSVSVYFCVKSKDLENNTTSDTSSLAFRAASAMFTGLLDVLILDYLLRFDRHVYNVGRLDVELALLQSRFVIEHTAEEDEPYVRG